MPVLIRTLLEQYTQGLVNIYGNHLKSVILYGSYARGDFTADSDIDIMILVKCDDDKIRERIQEVRDFTYDINEKYDSEIMPIVKNAEHFRIWIPSYPFYNNVAKEGIEINV